MAHQIRGTMDDSTKMLLGQIRQVFNPRWLQGFGEDNGFLLAFRNVPDSEEEVVRFAEMYGYELTEVDDSTDDGAWIHYRFR